MEILQVDVAVIGAGTAALRVPRSQSRRSERRDYRSGDYGTTCALVGCMPSKLLIAAAEAAHAVGQARNFGVHVDGVVRIDGREVMDRVRRERDALSSRAARHARHS